MLKKLLHADNWTKLVVLFLLASFVLGKASAYLGFAIGLLILFDSRVLLRPWYHALTRRGEMLSGFSWALLLTLFYGVIQVIYGVLMGNPLPTALQLLVFNICPLYLFLGIWVGMRRPEIVRVYIRFTAWFAVIYVPIYILFLSHVTLSLSAILPGSNLDLFGPPGSGSATLIGLLAYEPNLAPFWLPLLVLTGLTIANQMRADWLGLGLALIIWGFGAKKMGRVLAFACLVCALLLIGFMADIRLPAIPGRGGEISARETVARAAASFDPQMAEDLGSSRSNAQFYYGTIYWRTQWWAQIREAVSENYRTLIFGLGYGYPLASLGASSREQSETRSPHNIFYFTLAYSGWVGVILFFWLQICMFSVLWQTFKATGQVYCLAYYASLFVGSFFGNFYETPAALYLYLLMGFCIGPAVRDTNLNIVAPRLVYAGHGNEMALEPSTAGAQSFEVG
jgi:hypothetical protein